MNAGAYHAPEGGYVIEPDATAASYFLALPLMTSGSLRLPGLRGPGAGLQGDTAFVDVLREVGADIVEETGALCSKRLTRSRLLGVKRDFRGFSDTFLTLAAIAPLLNGSTRIQGIAHTRKQETDRVSGMVQELRRLGQEVEEEEDALVIHPRPLVRGIEVETYGDHRFAMSFAILGSHNLACDGQPWLSIRNPACCAKTFPGFFEVLDTLRARS